MKYVMCISLAPQKEINLFKKQLNSWSDWAGQALMSTVWHNINAIETYIKIMLAYFM